jgi:hypothetical protein
MALPLSARIIRISSTLENDLVIGWIGRDIEAGFQAKPCAHGRSTGAVLVEAQCGGRTNAFWEVGTVKGVRD